MLLRVAARISGLSCGGKAQPLFLFSDSQEGRSYLRALIESVQLDSVTSERSAHRAGSLFCSFHMDWSGMRKFQPTPSSPGDTQGLGQLLSRKGLGQVAKGRSTVSQGKWAPLVTCPRKRQRWVKSGCGHIWRGRSSHVSRLGRWRLTSGWKFSGI